MSRTIEKNCFRRFGCEYAQAITANSGSSLNAAGSMAVAYDKQRHNAALRGIEWRITFTEWVCVWNESGMWARRGRVAGCYCMARNADACPYAAWNVSIQPIEINNKAAIALARIDRSANGLQRRGKGRGWTFRHDQPNRPYWVRCGEKHVGSYATQEEAEAAYASSV